MAHVDSGAIQQAMKLCRESIDKLEQAGRSVKNKYEHAGSGWKDSKYSELGGIIGECVQTLQEPTGQLRDCMNILSEISAAIGQYEEVNF